jgi:hypothetical protein
MQVSKMRAAFDSAVPLWQGAPALGLAQLPPNTYLAFFREAPVGQRK